MHDPEAAVEYCSRLVKIADKLQGDLCIITSRSLAQLLAGRA
jgi:phospho-2-dehydro-3-deoxyheptonate aldolase